tara:strand:+ start:4718 stop:6106 length:1389 start_codon:yes stop_codon:yes gene_type:complete
MDKVNLDINTYTLTELENLLKLIKPYNEEDILNKKNNLENQITKSDINENKKEELYIFLDNIKNKLANEYLNSLIENDSLLNDVNKYDGNHFIINNNKNGYASVLENNKKVNKSIIKKTFTIDSIFRSNYDNPNNKSHDYIIELPETITNAVTMSISSIEIPLSYHNVSDDLNNNTFSIELNKKSVTGSPPNEVEVITNDDSWNIVLVPGLYESLFTSSAQRKAQNIETQINTQIKTQVNSNTQSANDISKNLTFKVDPISGFGAFIYNNKFAINEKVESGSQIAINFNIDNERTLNNCSENSLYQKLGWQLGFRSDKAIIDCSSAITSGPFPSIANPTATPDTASIISPCICHIAYPRYLYIAIDDFQTSSRNYFAVASPSTIAPNIISRINILSCLEDKTAFKNAGAPGDYLYTNKHVREYFGPTNIKRLRIQILDEFGRNFPINNMDWSFVASFECFYN